jgi:hypothetical protein
LSFFLVSILRLRDDYQQHSALNQQYGFISPTCAGVFRQEATTQSQLPTSSTAACKPAAATPAKPAATATATTTGRHVIAKTFAPTTISVDTGTPSVAVTGQQTVRCDNGTIGVAIEIFEDPGSCQACKRMCGSLAEKCKSAAQRRAKLPAATSAAAAADRYQQLQPSSQQSPALHSKLKGQRLDLTNSPTELRQIIQTRYEIQRNTRNTLRRLTKKVNAKKDEEETGDGEDDTGEQVEKKSEGSKQVAKHQGSSKQVNKHPPRAPPKMGK